MQEIVFVINNMGGKLSADNVEIINQLTELNFEDVNNVTYQNLIDERKDSLNMAYGYPMYKDSVEFWVLPSLNMGLSVNPNNHDIKEYTKEQYKKDILPFWDKEITDGGQNAF